MIPPIFPPHIRGMVLLCLDSTFLHSSTGLSPSTVGRSSPLRICRRGRTKRHIRPTFLQGIRIALCRVGSPLLTASRLLSLPPPTKMLQFGGFSLQTYRHRRSLRHSVWSAFRRRQEVPFSDPRFYGCMRLAWAYRSLPRPSSLPKPSYPLAGVGGNPVFRWSGLSVLGL